MAGFFSNISNLIRNDPFQAIGAGLQLGGAAASFFGSRNQISAASRIAALNAQQIQALAPLQIAAIDDQIVELRKISDLDTEEATTKISSVRDESDRVLRQIALNQRAITGGVTISSNISVSDIFSDGPLKNKEGDIVTALGRLGDLRRQKEQLEGTRTQEFATAGVRVSGAEFGDIEDAAYSTLDELSREIDKLDIDIQNTTAQLEQANASYGYELQAIEIQREAGQKAFESAKDEITKRAQVASLESGVEQEAFDAAQIGNIGSAVAGIASLLTGNNPIGNAIGELANQGLSAIGIGGGAAAGGSAISAAYAGQTAIGGFGMQGAGISGSALGGAGAAAAAGGAAAGGVSMAGIPSLASYPGFASAGGGVGIGIGALAAPALAAAALYVAGPRIASALMGDSESEAIRRARGHRAAESLIRDLESGSITNVAELQSSRPGRSLGDIQGSLNTAGGVGGGTPGFTGVSRNPETLTLINTLLSDMRPLMEEEGRRRQEEFSNYGGGGGI